VVEAAPPALKALLPLWGQPPGGLELMRRLRDKFDPQRIMVPGRLGWGLS
jgi:glycolate oxidase FAD binding subunit